MMGHIRQIFCEKYGKHLCLRDKSLQYYWKLFAFIKFLFKLKLLSAQIDVSLLCFFCIYLGSLTLPSVTPFECVCVSTCRSVNVFILSNVRFDDTDNNDDDVNDDVDNK